MNTRLQEDIVSTTERIEITYEGNAADHLDLALGIMAHRKSIQKGKGKKWRNLRYSAIVRRTFVRAGVFAALSVLLAVEFLLLNTGFGTEVSVVDAAILALEIGYTLFLLWAALTQRGELQKRMRDYAQQHSGGKLFFDDYGIEDTSSDGRSMRLPWAEYELCVITPEVLVLTLGNILYFMPAQPETAAQVIAALAHFGKSASVFDLRDAS